MATNYNPQPLDTSKVALPPELTELTEQLAKNIHDVWSAQRIAEGWKYGTERNDKKKLHPCLVPYENLPENEKGYDSNTALETVKWMLLSGFQITPPAKTVKFPNNVIID